MGIPVKEGVKKFFGLESSYKLNNWGYLTFHAIIVTFITTLFCIRIRRMTIRENFKKFTVFEKKKDIKRSS